MCVCVFCFTLKVVCFHIRFLYKFSIISNVRFMLSLSYISYIYNNKKRTVFVTVNFIDLTFDSFQKTLQFFIYILEYR